MDSSVILISRTLREDDHWKGNEELGLAANYRVNSTHWCMPKMVPFPPFTPLHPYNLVQILLNTRHTFAAWVRRLIDYVSSVWFMVREQNLMLLFPNVFSIPLAFLSLLRSHFDIVSNLQAHLSLFSTPSPYIRAILYLWSSPYICLKVASDVHLQLKFSLV